jgi:hypothetical protein
VAVSGLMGSVDAVWLYVFVMDFLNSLAREKIEELESISEVTEYNTVYGVYDIITKIDARSSFTAISVPPPLGFQVLNSRFRSLARANPPPRER